MAADATPRHAGIYLLGDHLDAALAMGEDLLTEKVALADPLRKLTTARLVRQNREISEFLTTVRTLELSLTSRLMQARRRAEDLKRRRSPPEAADRLVPRRHGAARRRRSRARRHHRTRLRDRRHGPCLPARPRPDCA